jgi:putative ATPase
MAQNAAAAVDRVGLPEANLILSEAVIYLACAPKSNSTTMAIGEAEKAIASGDLMQVPYHLRNDGEGYIYPHNYPGHWVAQAYLPEVRRFYKPGNIGAETRIGERLKKLWKRFSEDDNGSAKD